MCFANGNLCPAGVPRNTMTEMPDKYGAPILSPISVPDSALSFPLCATDEQLLLGIWQWVDKLAEQKFAEAFQLTAQDKYYDWSPELIRSVIEGYGHPHTPGERKYQVSKLLATKGGPPTRWHVDREIHYCFAQIFIDLPLDGEWSDLSATFEVVQHKHSLVLVLNEIRVF